MQLTVFFYKNLAYGGFLDDSNKVHCFKCGHIQSVLLPIPRSAACPKCLSDLKSCKNCYHYRPGSNNSCLESQAELVSDKERKNFCSFFIPRDSSFKLDKNTATSKNQKNKFNQLFNHKISKENENDQGNQVKTSFDDLFNK